ncbi:ATP-binding protein [uncultured Maritalea sp.]|uniref:sensor histidine kinase n=1 Tax=uncultured Maritalea sp. TaxID=757249 RepID=UPI002629C1EA|nr:ATP-binding protein [uncultured Maritalea sp.]
MRSTTIENPSEIQRWRDRFYAARWVLITCVLVFGSLYLTGKLAFADALLAFLLIFLAAIVVPRRARLMRADLPSKDKSTVWPDTSLKRFAQALPDPCLIVDRRAILRYRNSAAASEFPASSVGDPLAFSLRNPILLNTIDQAIKTDSRVTGEFHETVPSANWYQVSVTPLEPKNAKVGPTKRSELLVVTIVSQTAQRKHDQMRADFVANASHELRTPLTSLIGFLDTLRGPAANDAAAREKFMAIMHAQAERMSRLIDDLLSLSRIELRQHMRPTTKADMGAIAKEAIEHLQPQAGEENVEINFINELDDATITGDRNELMQVMTNLIENAIKYGAAGKKVDVQLRSCSQHANHKVVVEVIDYGQGIPAEHVPRLTERFYRVDAESSRRKKGTGLGLAIVKHIITRHRGDLHIFSEVGKGTKVSLHLS